MPYIELVNFATRLRVSPYDIAYNLGYFKSSTVDKWQSDNILPIKVSKFIEKCNKQDGVV